MSVTHIKCPCGVSGYKATAGINPALLLVMSCRGCGKPATEWRPVTAEAGEDKEVKRLRAIVEDQRGELARLRAESKSYKQAEYEAWDIRCRSSSNHDGGDEDIEWFVVGDWTVGDEGRELGQGKTPLQAIQEAAAAVKETDDER